MRFAGRQFAASEKFKMVAQKWDLKCTVNSKFYRLALRPNLGKRKLGLGMLDTSKIDDP